MTVKNLAVLLALVSINAGFTSSTSKYLTADDQVSMINKRYIGVNLYSAIIDLQSSFPFTTSNDIYCFRSHISYGSPQQPIFTYLKGDLSFNGR